MARYINIVAIHFQVSERKDEKPDSALQQLQEAQSRLEGTGADLIVTCEGMESVGQTMRQAECVARPGRMLAAYQQLAQRCQCTVAGSIKLEEAGKIYNALVYLDRDGKILGDYRKTYTTQGELDMGVTPGPGATVVETPAGRLGGAICFDLNFDDLRDAYRPLQPDVLCFSSMFHGGHLQQNWAYQCRCFFAGACKDNTSDILDPHGRILNSTNYYNRIAWARVNLDRFIMHQDGNNTRFADIRRKYGNQILIDVAPGLGTAILYSCDARMSAYDVAREFGLVSIDAYFAASRRLCGTKPSQVS